MAQLSIRINGYAYTVACEDGQEAHLRAMAERIDERIGTIKDRGNQSGESRLLMLAALLLEDELHDLRLDLADAQKIVAGGSPRPTERSDKKLAVTIGRLADRAEQIATALEEH